MWLEHNSGYAKFGGEIRKMLCLLLTFWQNDTNIFLDVVSSHNGRVLTRTDASGGDAADQCLGALDTGFVFYRKVCRNEDYYAEQNR